MKKFLLAIAATTIALGAFVSPVMAAEGTGTTTIGYSDGVIPDPDNPNNPDWGVKIPKSFDFTKDMTSKDMAVTLVENNAAGLDAAKKVQVDVASANAYKLVNATNTSKGSLAYTLAYGANTNTDGEIGALTKDAKTIAGTATLTDPLTDSGIDGRYEDVLTYTVHSAIAK